MANRQLIVEELLPVPEPWNVAQLFSTWPHLLFLDSADHDTSTALNRYSYVAARPVQWLTVRSDDPDSVRLDGLQQHINAYQCDHVSGLPPFQGGLAGLFGYDLAHWTEKLPRPRFDEFGVPDLAVGIYEWVIAWDHHDDRAWLIAHPIINAKVFAEVRDRCRQVIRVDSAPPKIKTTRRVVPAITHSITKGISSNFTRSDFESAVARIIEYIHAGDCFQVNLAQRLLASEQEPLALYGRLRRCNPAPFAAYFDTGAYVIASASPERFLKVDETGHVETRPIKGTRAKRADLHEDDQLRRELLASPKDRAENVMIVDLLRNDLGKVCRYGSIQVNKVCALETYRTVHHLVSEVVGQLRQGATAIDLLRGAFPGGSVTGAPKIRAMEIIAELEPTVRGPYCGSLGYLGFNGCMDTNILIRTFTLGGGFAQFPVGAGIVADSDPATEYEETLAKAEGLLRALAP